MDSSGTQSPHARTGEQMAILVVVVLQEFGARLTRRQFDEVMLAIFEHIPGFDALLPAGESFGASLLAIPSVPQRHILHMDSGTD